MYFLKQIYKTLKTLNKKLINTKCFNYKVVDCIV